MAHAILAKLCLCPCLSGFRCHNISYNISCRRIYTCFRLIVYSYKKKIEQLLEDMKTCGTKEEYQEAILWTKQYVAQQVRVIQAELESKVGAEKAKTLVEQVMKENAVVN